MNFKTPTMKRKLSLLADCNKGPSEQKKLDTQIPEPSESKLHQFFVKSEGSNSYVPVNHLPDFPKPLTELYSYLIPVQ